MYTSQTPWSKKRIIDFDVEGGSNAPACRPVKALPVPLVYLAAVYGGYKITLRRNQSYEESVKLIQAGFPALQALSGERIGISAYLEPDPKEATRITKDVWPLIVDTLATVYVSTLPLPTLEIERGGIEITVDTHNMQLSLPLSPTTTFLRLKQIISEHDQTAPSKMSLILLDGNKTVPEDERTIQSYGLKSGSKVAVCMEVELSVYYSNSNPPTTTFVKTALYATLENLKVLLWSVLGVLPRHQVLLCDGESLSDSKRELKSYDILCQTRAIVVTEDLKRGRFFRPPRTPADASDFSVHLNILKVEVLTMQLLGRTTVLEFQILVYHNTDIPPAEQRLIHNYKQLNDPDAQLSDCFVRNGSIIYLVKKLLPDGVGAL